MALKNYQKNIILFGFKNYFLGAVGNDGKKLSALSPTALNIFYRRRRQRLTFFMPSPIALKIV
jgi:hypothetical protein